MFRIAVALQTLLIQIASLATTPAQDAAPSAVPDAAAMRPAQVQQKFTGDRLDQLVAPIALYPDALLAQVLMAATYPLEVVEAARFMPAHAGLAGESLEAGLRDKDWDASVKSLCGFPDLLQRMNDNLDWMRDLGDASLAQQGELMDAVQRMRARASAAGNLKSTKEIVITERPDRVIEIAPATVEVVYVPSYYPTSVYGGWSAAWWWYPAFFVAPPPGLPFFWFGPPIPWGFGLWGRCDWGFGHGYVSYDVRARNQFVQRTFVDPRPLIITAPAPQMAWQHEPAHRHGVTYRNAAVATKYGAANGRTSRINPADARGRIAPPATTMPRNPRPPRLPGSEPKPTPRPAPTTGGHRGGAFSGVHDPALDRASSQRGNGSVKQSQSRPPQAAQPPRAAPARPVAPARPNPKEKHE